ncbi:MAG TPA: hypothetical protein VFC16_15555 [Nakamurella sp.]|nr:hypothetical protein [Nakamurella sp.]
MTDSNSSSLEPVVGVYGLRTFRVSLDGNLLPLAQLSNDWVGGRCVARCAVGGDHTAPETACTCGIHSFRDLAHLAKQFAAAAESLVAVVALEGATVEGERGWRSQAAQVVAVWIADDALPSHLRTALLDRLPGVRGYSSPDEMVAAYPGLTSSGGSQPAPSLLPREAATAVTGLVRRWGLIKSATFLFTVGVKTAVLSCLLQVGLVDSAEPQGVLQSWLTATRNLLTYLVVNPRVLTAAYAMAIIVGTVIAIGRTRKLAWLAGITWRAATLSLALPLAAAFAGFNPPWAAWYGFAVIYMLMHGCAAFAAAQNGSVMATVGTRAWPHAQPGGQDLNRHELVEPVTFPSPTCP